MRMPYNPKPSLAPQEFNPKRVIVARNYQFVPKGEQNTFLKDFPISSSMPIYAIDLVKPVNFSKLDSFQKVASDAKVIWEKELGKPILQTSLVNLEDINQGHYPSPNLPETQLQNLLDS